MTIRANIMKVKKAILNEIDEQDRPQSDEVKTKALLAIRAGQKTKDGQSTKEWKDYMMLFVDNPNAVNDPASLSAKQLSRLLGEDQTAGVPDFENRRAYLISDGPCTVDTAVNFGRNASVVLDQDL